MWDVVLLDGFPEGIIFLGLVNVLCSLLQKCASNVCLKKRKK